MLLVQVDIGGSTSARESAKKFVEMRVWQAQGVVEQRVYMTEEVRRLLCWRSNPSAPNKRSLGIVVTFASLGSSSLLTAGHAVESRGEGEERCESETGICRSPGQDIYQERNHTEEDVHSEQHTVYTNRKPNQYAPHLYSKVEKKMG